MKVIRHVANVENIKRIKFRESKATAKINLMDIHVIAISTEALNIKTESTCKVESIKRQSDD